MRYFPAPLSRDQSDALAERERILIDARGWGLWAVELRETETFVGFVGLAEPQFTAHFTPAVEVGWRLVRNHWRRGYATEAARAALSFGFDHLDLAEIVSLTTVGNEPSRRVMERLGMTRQPADDFEHPLLAPGHPLRAHVLYRLLRITWRAQPATARASSSGV